MGFTALTCPNCGASVELSEDREYGFCTYCGTKVVQDKIVVEHRGKITVNGIADVETVLNRAFLLIEDKEYFQAITYLEKALDLDPQCSKAYIGKMLCQLQIPSIDALKTAQGLKIRNNEFYKKALRFATKAERSEYEQLPKLIDDNTMTAFQEELNRRKEAMDLLLPQIKEKEAFIKANTKKNILNHSIRFILVPSIFVSSVADLLSGIFAIQVKEGENASFGRVLFGVIFLIIAVLLLFLIKKLSATQKIIKEYNIVKGELSHLYTEYSSAQTRYADWQKQKPERSI